jgi:hypothetical protein
MNIKKNLEVSHSLLHLGLWMYGFLLSLRATPQVPPPYVMTPQIKIRERKVKTCQFGSESKMVLAQHFCIVLLRLSKKQSTAQP